MIKSVDHIVLTVRDVEATLKFYVGFLGMKEVTFRGGRKALEFGSQKINIHEYGREFEPKAKLPVPGAIDICFITDVPIEDVAERASEHGVEIVEGPVERTGAVGPILSLYFRDPDLNLIEVSNYI
ncbi:MAG: VOC family protein [Deferribacterales bacterium]